MHAHNETRASQHGRLTQHAQTNSRRKTQHAHLQKRHDVDQARGTRATRTRRPKCIRAGRHGLQHRLQLHAAAEERLFTELQALVGMRHERVHLQVVRLIHLLTPSLFLFPLVDAVL